MANTVIQLKYSSTPSSVPSSLANGEIALNYADGKFYYKNLTGQIVSFSGSGNVYSFATINANGSLITAAAANSILTISNGDNIEISGDIINDIITIKANLKPSFDVANAGFDKANAANLLIVQTHSELNAFITLSNAGANAHANMSADSANAYARVFANSVGYSTNTYSITRFATIENAAAAFYEANLAWEFANSVAYNAAAGFAVANAAFNAANNAVTDFSPAFNKANDAYTVANAAYNYANTLSSGGGTGGFFSSTLTSFPTGDFGSGESYPTTELSDAFGVSLENVYDCMEPVGHYNLVDLGVLT